MKTLLLVLMVCWSTVVQAVTLCEDGHAKAVIVVDPACLPSERKAADELAKYLRQITGGEYPVVSEPPDASQSATIFVGRGALVDTLVGDLSWDRLRQDGIVIKTIDHGLILAGGQPRGSLYAVYTFLEDYLGCRWWTTGASSIPSRKNISVDAIDQVDVPSLYYRESHYRQSYDDQHPDFAVQLKLNGIFQTTPEEWGGHEFFINGGHSFARLIPADQHFASHPEWYSLVNGVRKQNAQLCLSNSAMRKECLRRVLETIAAQPAYTIVDVSQNDNEEYCRCDACMALANQYGGQSGLLVDFVNEIAGGVAKQYPRHLVETMAYTYTEEAPVNIRPADNVVIRLCGIGNDNAQPVDAESNKVFSRRLSEWARVAPKLLIWDYVANFTNYHIPHANIHVLGPNVRQFVKAGAVGIFEQGDLYNDSVCFAELRNWVLAKLLWNPSLDENALIDTFLGGYYGQAGPEIRKVLDIYTTAVTREKYRLSCYHAANPYLKKDDYLQAFACFDRAKGVAELPDIQNRLETQRKGLELSLLLDPDLRKDADCIEDAGIGDIGAWCDHYLQWAERTGNAYVGERQLLTIQYFSDMGLFPDHSRSGEFPERCRRLRHEDWFDIQDGGFVLLGNPDQAFRVEDTKASNRWAVRMPCNHSAWAVNVCVSPMIRNGIQEGEVFVAVRKQSPEMVAGFSAGIFNHDGWKGVTTVSFPNADLSTEYKEFSLGTHRLEKDMWIWVAPVQLGNPNSSIYVDRVFIVRK